MITLQDAIDSKLEGIKIDIVGHIKQLEKFMDSIECKFFNPEDAPIEIAQAWSKFTNAIWDELEEVADYGMFKDFRNFLDKAEEELLKLVSRFNRWTRRRILSTAEAAKMISRSRSSVYYWIRTGKLEAQKINGRWQILV